jgi:hypothetical protein
LAFLSSRKEGEKLIRSSNTTFGHQMKQIHGRERWQKKLCDGDPSPGVDPLGGGGGRSLGHDEPLTLGRAVAGLNAYSKGVSLGLFHPTPKEVKEQRRKMRKEEMVTIELLPLAVPAKYNDEGLRALSGESFIHPENVQKYLGKKFVGATCQLVRLGGTA